MANQLIKHETKPSVMQMSIEQKSKSEFIRAFSCLTPAKIVEEAYPSVGSLTKQYDIDKVENAIKGIVADLSHSFEGTLDQDGIEEVAIEITSSHLMNLSLEDIYLACRKLKLKDNNFSKLNSNKVLSALKKQMEERTIAYAQHNENKHLSGKYIDRNRKGGLDEVKEKFKQANLLYLEKHPPKNPDDK